MFFLLILFAFLAGTQLSNEPPLISSSHSLIQSSDHSFPHSSNHSLIQSSNHSFLHSFNPSIPPPHEYLPIVHFDKQPIVKGLLNGREVFFMLDSGSSMSLLNSAEARQFDFKVSPFPAKNRNLNGLGGKGGRPYHLSRYEIQLGSQVLQGTFYAYPLQQLFSEMNNYKPVGIIGSQLLKAYGCSIDFKNQRLRINKRTP